MMNSPYYFGPPVLGDPVYENYNSVLAKFVCFFKRRSYEMRCNAAGVSFNSMGTYQEIIHRLLTNKTPGKHTKKICKC
jgi:hypothetical protein